MIRFALFPDYIYSANGGGRTFVPAARLAQFYGVDLRECVVVDVRRPETCHGVDVSRLLALRPKYMHYARVTPAERRLYPISPDEDIPRERVEPLPDWVLEIERYERQQRPRRERGIFED